MTFSKYINNGLDIEPNWFNNAISCVIIGERMTTDTLNFWRMGENQNEVRMFDVKNIVRDMSITKYFKLY